MAERISYLKGGKATPEPEPVAVGDIVKTGPNDYPRFKVIAIDGDRAWIRNVISLTECCWRVDEREQNQRIGRMLREEPIHHKTGTEAPVEPRRIDRAPSDDGEPATAPQGG